MKHKLVSCCEYCDFESADEYECFKHEASHFKLSSIQYREWLRLQERAEDCGKRVSVSKNASSEKKFDDAVKDLLNFEENHNLIHMFSKLRKRRGN